MNILVRMPNWLGDMVMATAFLKAVRQHHKPATLDIIVKQELAGLVKHIPSIDNVYAFNKRDFPGIRGAFRFGRQIRLQKRYDLLYCLPDSFSSALMAKATGARHRVGYKNELRSWLLTHRYPLPRGLHRTEKYLHLLEHYLGHAVSGEEVGFENEAGRQPYIVLNINSEASSRRLTHTKAVEFLNELVDATDREIVLIGSPKEAPFVESVLSASTAKEHRVKSVAGNTSLVELASVLGSASLVISTDSGPAHLANALHTPTVVLFGAGNERHTAPSLVRYREIVRLGALSCEPCEKNTCTRFSTPQCLERLPTRVIIENAIRKYASSV